LDVQQKTGYRSRLLEIEKENLACNSAGIFQLDGVSDAYLETEYKVSE